eukprot:3960725-Prorocentrum_lima.AAC.1
MVLALLMVGIDWCIALQGQCTLAPWASLAHGAARASLAQAVWGPTLLGMDWRGGRGDGLAGA